MAMNKTTDSFRALLRAKRDPWHPDVVHQAERYIRAGHWESVVQSMVEYLVIFGLNGIRLPPAAGESTSELDRAANLAIDTMLDAYIGGGGWMVTRYSMDRRSLHSRLFAYWRASFAPAIEGEIDLPELNDPIVEARLVLSAQAICALLLERRQPGESTDIVLREVDLDSICRGAAEIVYNTIKDPNHTNHVLHHGEAGEESK